MLTTVLLQAIDVALDGFNMAQAAMDKLTGGQANQIGRVNADIQQVCSYAGLLSVFDSETSFLFPC